MYKLGTGWLFPQQEADEPLTIFDGWHGTDSVAVVPQGLPYMLGALACIEARKQINDAKIVHETQGLVMLVCRTESAFILVKKGALLLGTFALHILQ